MKTILYSKITLAISNPYTTSTVGNCSMNSRILASFQNFSSELPFSVEEIHMQTQFLLLRNPWNGSTNL